MLVYNSVNSGGDHLEESGNIPQPRRKQTLGGPQSSFSHLGSVLSSFSMMSHEAAVCLRCSLTHIYRCSSTSLRCSKSNAVTSFGKGTSQHPHSEPQSSNEIEKSSYRVYPLYLFRIKKLKFKGILTLSLQFKDKMFSTLWKAQGSRRFLVQAPVWTREMFRLMPGHLQGTAGCL